MTTVTAPTTHHRPPATLRRVGYTISVAGNAALLWIAHHLLEWQWPDFLTADFDAVLPVLTASLVAGILVNAGYLLDDREHVRAFGDLVTAAFSLAVLARFWSVFPIDFATYDNDWSGLVRLLLGLGIFGTSVGAIASLVKLFRPTSA